MILKGLNYLLLIEEFPEEQIIFFVNKWNNSVNDENIDTNLPFIDKSKLDKNDEIIISVEDYAKSLGYFSGADMLDKTLNNIENDIN